MKVNYLGHEIDVKRERSLGGQQMLYYSIFRVSDGYECTSGCTEDASSVLEYIDHLQARIDAELADDDPWGEKARDSPFEPPVRPYPLNVQSCGGDDSYTLMSKGHHDHAAFLKACEEYLLEPLLGGHDGPAHMWWRFVPARPGGDYIGQYHKSKPGERGAFPCTAITWR